MTNNGRNIAILEPYYGGSHQAFVDTIMAHSRHRYRMASMAARHWKWRMRGAAMWLAGEARAWLRDARDPVEAILTCDMLSVSDLRAMLPAGRRDLPIACYFHENQLTYPLAPDDQLDYQYALTNLTSCLASDAVWFNTAYHRDAFLSAIERLLRQMPDYDVRSVLRVLAERIEVIHPPVVFDDTPRCTRDSTAPPVILWCHRWEFDKNPEPFFDALLDLHRRGFAFELVVLGEQFRTAPRVFREAISALSGHVLHVGYVPSHAEYRAWLCRCDLVVSTAVQENFGIAVVESIMAGCQPLLINRLSYPEVIPEPFHEACLFDHDSDLPRLLEGLLSGQGWVSSERLVDLRAAMHRLYGRRGALARLDAGLDALASA